nr:hypothetical protein [uncultured Sphingomonas sp.]
MRVLFLALPFSLALAAPAAAAAQQAPPAIPPALTDPAMADTLGRVMGALTKAIMDMPVGEVQAAVEGRPATPADRDRRVRDEVGGPDVERRVEAQAAQSGRQVQAMGQAMAQALPGIMASLDGVERQIERAVSNLPDPTYPRR